MKDTVKILAIDGGGIRGIFPAQILKRIQEELKTDFVQEFDIITGTSTGAIIAAGLAISHPISDIVNLYRTEGSNIFRRNYSDIFNFLNLKALFSSKYDSGYLKKLLNDIFKDLTLGDSKTKLIIPTSDISNGNVFVFKSPYKQEFVRDKHTRIADAVIASCSAPYYFTPSKVKEYLLADGGLWANNPALIALTEVLGPRFNKKTEQIKILSLGTGISKKYYNPKDYRNKWGLIDWGIGLVETTMSLQSINVHNTVRFIMNSDERYLRMNYESDKGVALDDVSSTEQLIAKADEAFTYNFKKIQEFIKED